MAADGNDDGIFVYLGGEQEVPDGVTHAIIDPSVKTVRFRAFYKRRQLVSVIFHEGVEIVEEEAFYGCESLPRINLLGVREIRDVAFMFCDALTDVVFSDRLETIGYQSFSCCPLRSIKVPSVRTVEDFAFSSCLELMDVEFGIDLETIEANSFYGCTRLQRIIIPLKGDIFPLDLYEERYNQFHGCDDLKTVDLVGAEGVQKTISTLFLKIWRDEMSVVVGQINRELPNTLSVEKTIVIRLWIRSVINRLEHFKAEHNRIVKDHMTQLELAVWKAKLDEKDDDSAQRVQIKRAKIDVGNARKEKRITSGADIIIKNVLPFLKFA